MPEEARADPFEEGCTDPRHRLQDRLPSAPTRYAEGAMGNPALDEGLIEIMLRNPGLDGELLRRVARDGRFRRFDVIKRALVMHPNTPPNVSLTLVKFVPWRDLLKVVKDRQIPPPVRAAAEKTVGDRMNQLPSMEQARLARTAGRGVIPAFLRVRNPRVIHELLLNPRVVERDVGALARDVNTPAEVLGSLARNAQWMRRAALRSALLENQATPIQDAVSLVAGLATPVLREFARNVRIRAPIRIEAKRQLQARQSG